MNKNIDNQKLIYSENRLIFVIFVKELGGVQL